MLTFFLCTSFRVLYPVEMNLRVAGRAEKLKVLQFVATAIAPPHNMMDDENILVCIPAALTLRPPGYNEPSLEGLRVFNFIF
jgi:hypothetical protein